MALSLPRNLARYAVEHPETGLREWIELELPDVVAETSSRWSLRLGEPFQPGGQCSWVAPAINGPFVLKAGFRFPSGEGRDEADGLRMWHGDGTVLLHEWHRSGSADVMLLERCDPGTPLRAALPEPEQDEVVAGLLRRLWSRPPLPTFRPLHDMCAAWADTFECDYALAPETERIDPGLARAGIALFRSLPRSCDERVPLCTDLHADNVLAAERKPWLVIDPKPYAGDPAYDVLQHMLNCADRLLTDPRGFADRMAALTGLNADRVRQWLFARCVQESVRWPGKREVAVRLGV